MKHSEYVNERIILCHIDPLLVNDRETNIETTVIAMQQLRKYATVLKSLLGNGSTVGSGVYYVVRSEAVSRDRPSSMQLVQCSPVQCNGVSEPEDCCGSVLVRCCC
jgi:hypothetical protein